MNPKNYLNNPEFLLFPHTDPANCWTMAHGVFPLCHLFGVILSCQLDLSHCRHVVRSTAGWAGGRGSGWSCWGGAAQTGKTWDIGFLALTPISNLWISNLKSHISNLKFEFQISNLKSPAFHASVKTILVPMVSGKLPLPLSFFFIFSIKPPIFSLLSSVPAPD